MQIVLEVIEGPHRGQRYAFDGHDNFIVGRAPCAHFRLPRKDLYFSRVHFMVEVNPPCCRLSDAGSTNGTFVNGARVEAIDLRHGDLIRGGDTVLKVLFLDAAESTESFVPAAAPDPAPLPAAAETSAAPPPAAADPPPLPEMSAAPRTCFDEQSSRSLPRVPGYRLVRQLGRGGMGVVYLAVRTADGSQVALKTIRPTVAGAEREVQRFLREAEILRELQHPKIVAFHEMGRQQEFLYFVMDYVPGTDAARLVARHGPLAVARAVRLVSDALEGLSHAHQQGFVHRDVKLANLLITGPKKGIGPICAQHPSGRSGKLDLSPFSDERETCRLADFGLARVYHASPMSGLTIMGDTGGTLPYMPPEQITDYRNVSPAADQYATAATLYRMLTGSFLFDFDEVPKQKQLTMVLFDEPVPITARRGDVPQELAQVIHRALAKKPADRYPDAAAFRTALAPFADGK